MNAPFQFKETSWKCQNNGKQGSIITSWAGQFVCLPGNQQRTRLVLSRWYKPIVWDLLHESDSTLALWVHLYQIREKMYSYMIFRSEKSRLISTVLLRTCIKSDQRKLGLENLWPCSEEEKGDGCPGVGAAGAGSRDWRSAWASANGRHRHAGAAHAEGLDAGWPALAKAGLGCNGRWSYRHQRERNAEESRAEP